MEIRYKLYPYPVLAAYFDDTYRTSYFKAEAEKIFEKGENIIKISTSLKNKEISELIKNHRACYAHHFECAETAFRKLYTSYEPDIKIPLSDKEVQGRLKVCCFILAKEDLKNFTSSDFADDYAGLTFDIDKGSILATNNETFDIDIKNSSDTLAKVPSIFSIQERINDTLIRIDTSNKNKIVINLPKNDYIKFNILNNNAVNKPILYSMVIFPALITVLAQIRSLTDSACTHT